MAGKETEQAEAEALAAIKGARTPAQRKQALADFEALVNELAPVQEVAPRAVPVRLGATFRNGGVGFEIIEITKDVVACKDEFGQRHHWAAGSFGSMVNEE